MVVYCEAWAEAVSHSHVWSRSLRRLCSTHPKDTALPQLVFLMSPMQCIAAPVCVQLVLRERLWQ